MPSQTAAVSVGGQFPNLAISPDGRTVVFGTNNRLHQRALDRLDAEPVPGTEGANFSFFSPDGEWLGFTRAGTIMKVAARGGPPIKVADATSGGNAGLWSVRADGGVPHSQSAIVTE